MPRTHLLPLPLKLYSRTGKRTFHIVDQTSEKGINFDQKRHSCYVACSLTTITFVRSILLLHIAAAAAATKPLTMVDVKQDYADVLFDVYGRVEGKVSLKVDTSVQPVRMPLRKLPIPIRDCVAKEMQHLEASDIIVRVSEPKPWISSLLVTARATLDLRVCIDPTPLNRALLTDRHYMP